MPWVCVLCTSSKTKVANRSSPPLFLSQKIYIRIRGARGRSMQFLSKHNSSPNWLLLCSFSSSVECTSFNQPFFLKKITNVSQLDYHDRPPLLALVYHTEGLVVFLILKHTQRNPFENANRQSSFVNTRFNMCWYTYQSTPLSFLTFNSTFFIFQITRFIITTVVAI